MTTTTRERAAHCDDAPNTATDDRPPAEDLVPVLASRSSVIAALRGEAPDFYSSERRSRTGADDSVPPQEESAEELKKRYDKKTRQTERQADARLGIKQCPVKLPTNLHDALRQFARHATDDSRALLAFATFLLRPELWELLPTIELRKDNDELLAALHVVFHDEQLVQIVIRLAASAAGSSTPGPEHGQSLIAALLRDTALMNACLAVYTDPLLQSLCAGHHANDGSNSLVLQAISQPDSRAFFARLLALPSSTRDIVEKVLELDDDDMRALRGALQNRDVFIVLYHAAHSRGTRAAMQIAIRDSRTSALGLAVLQGKGLAGWIARTAARFLSNATV